MHGRDRKADLAGKRKVPFEQGPYVISAGIVDGNPGPPT
jgi:hypothetical protein